MLKPPRPRQHLLGGQMPEPGSLVLFGTGLTATYFAARRLSRVRNVLRRNFIHVHNVLLRFLPRSK
jgi:hypothetical protein